MLLITTTKKTIPEFALLIKISRTFHPIMPFSSDKFHQSCSPWHTVKSLMTAKHKQNYSTLTVSLWLEYYFKMKNQYKRFMQSIFTSKVSFC